MTPLSPQKSRRSTEHGTIAGVCAGSALSKGWSGSLVRTFYLLLLSLSGFGLLLYLVLWVVLPTARSIGIVEPETLPNDPYLRSKSDRKIAGVCGGLAKHVGTDATWIRLIYALAVLCGCVGLISYLYAWLIVPEEN